MHPAKQKLHDRITLLPLDQAVRLETNFQEVIEASEEKSLSCSTELPGSLENTATPRFVRGYKDRLYLATASRDEFGEDQETHHYISVECAKRLQQELADFL